MELNLENLKTFIKEHFDGNSTKAAKAMDLNTSTLTRLLAKKTSPGKKVFEAIITYCKKNEIDYTNIIKV